MREDCLRKYFLEAGLLAQRESLTPARLIDWCELGDLRARRIGERWFIDLDDWEINRARLVNNFQTGSSPAAHSPFLPLILALFLVGIIGWVPLTTRFQEGSKVLTAAVVGATTHAVFNDQIQAQMASVYDGLWIRLERFWFGWDQFIKIFANNLEYFWHQATGAWGNFIGPKKTESETANSAATSTAITLLTLDAATLQSLKAEIKAELLRDLGQETKPPPNSPNVSGLVILPSSGDSAHDEALKLELRNSFSDQVEVRFDSSGQAGIITPIFQSDGGTSRGDNYLFILTPLKRNP